MQDKQDDEAEMEESEPVEQEESGDVAGPTLSQRRNALKFEEFALPDGTYDTVKTIIRALGKSGGAGTTIDNKRICQTAGLSLWSVSINNKFLVSCGILIKSGRNVSLSQEGYQLALALDYNDSHEIASAWKSLIYGNEFLRRMLDSLHIRGDVAEEDFAKAVARGAGAPNETKYVRGGQTVIDIMIDAGLAAKTEEKKIRVTQEYESLETLDVEKRDEKPDSATAPTPTPKDVVVRHSTYDPEIHINVNITLTADTTDEELDRIASRITDLARRIHKPDQDDSSTP